MMNNENMERCKAIADNLEKVASGDYFLYDGELFPIDTDDFSEVKGCRYDEENELYIMADGEELFAGDVYPVRLFDWIGDNVYDIEYIIGGDKEYRNVRIMVACGGPNIYLNTRTKDVELYWGSEHVSYPMSLSVIEMIDSTYEEMFACM